MCAKITNIKVSLNIQYKSLDSVEKDCLRNNLFFKKYNNFIIIKSCFIYTVFKNSKKNFNNHVNITKIKSFEELSLAIDFLKSIDFIVIEESIKTDNITGSLNINKEIFLIDLIDSLNKNNYNEENNTIILKYNNEKFPGLFVKVKNNQKNKVGTIIIFHSGKIIFVGCKTIENLKCLSQIVHAHTQVK